ncbi:hypothetical protein ACFWCF_25310 [Rhodococcus sp. NPDC060090]|uniref:hypothetical protein n=1 Tax=Rhodococcus sp. NPDC060090 TaxID=3347056 RepID=UPI0036592BFB
MSLSLQIQLAIALNIYALAMILARSWIYRVPVYRPMVKNFFLSVAPLLHILVVASSAVVAGLLWQPLGLAAARRPSSASTGFLTSTTRGNPCDGRKVSPSRVVGR